MLRSNFHGSLSTGSGDAQSSTARSTTAPGSVSRSPKQSNGITRIDPKPASASSTPTGKRALGPQRIDQPLRLCAGLGAVTYTGPIGIPALLYWRHGCPCCRRSVVVVVVVAGCRRRRRSRRSCVAMCDKSKDGRARRSISPIVPPSACAPVRNRAMMSSTPRVESCCASSRRFFEPATERRSLGLWMGRVRDNRPVRLDVHAALASTEPSSKATNVAFVSNGAKWSSYV